MPNPAWYPSSPVGCHSQCYGENEDGIQEDFPVDEIAEHPVPTPPVFYDSSTRDSIGEAERWQELKESLRKELLAELQEKMVSKEHLRDQLREHLPVMIQQLSNDANRDASNDPANFERRNNDVIEIDTKQTVSSDPKQTVCSKQTVSSDPQKRTRSLSKINRSTSNFGRSKDLRGSTFVADIPIDDDDEAKRNSVGELCTAVQSDGVPILDARANELGAQDWVYNWAETMWDAMPFLGLGVMTVSDSVLVVLIAILNLVIQAAFIGLVGANMTESLFHDDEVVGTLQDWRVSYAHNPDFADKFTSTPLGADVCSQSNFLMQGAQQATLYNEVLEYIRNFLGMPAGACLSLLAIFVWILTCCKEMKRITLFTVGMWTPNSDNVGMCNNEVTSSHVLIQERTVLWVYGEATQKNYQIFLTRFRVLTLSVLVVLPRLLVLLSLGFVGSQFLVATTELDELILNCVALEVVLNVDELLFTIFVPDSAARMVRKTKPLRVPKLRGVQSRLMPWIRVLVVCALMSYIAVASLAPLIATMKDVERVMCGGNVDFLAVELKLGHVVSGTPQNFGIDRSEYRYLAIYQRTGLQESSETSTSLALENSPFEFTRVQTMDEWRSRSIEDWASLSAEDQTMLPCVDKFWPSWRNPELLPAFWKGLSSKVGVQGLSDCAQVKPLCYSDSSHVGKTVRLLCPVTCGAVDAVSGLMPDQPIDGTPKECQSPFASSLSQLPCQDYPLHVLTNMSHPIGQGWKNYAVSAVSMVSSVFMTMSLGNETHYQGLMNKLWIGMSTQGCNFFSRKGPTQGKTMYYSAVGTPYPVDFCEVADPRLFGRRSIRPFCPQACACDTSVKDRYDGLGETWNERTGLESQCPKVCWASPPSAAP